MSSGLYSQFLREQQEKAKAAAPSDATSLYNQYLAEKQAATTPAEPEESTLDKITGGARAVLHGATLGLSDDINALGNTIMPQSMGGVKGFDFPTALANEKAARSKFSQNHPTISGGLETLGSLPAIAATGGMGEAGQGLSLAARVANAAKFGGAYGAVGGMANAGNSISDKIGGGLGGAALGAAGGAALQGLTEGASNLLNRRPLRPLTNAVGGLINKASPELGSTIGTRGQVNSALSDRQEILDAIGGKGESAAKQHMDQIAATKAGGDHYYGLARQDTKPLQNPELTALLADPQVSRAYEIAGQIRDTGPNPLPRTEAPSVVPPGLGMSQERFDELQKMSAYRASHPGWQNEPIGAAKDATAGTSVARIPVNNGIEALPPELSGKPDGGVVLPDPQVLSTLKRELGNAAKTGINSNSAFSQEQALNLLPKVARIREILHEESPAWEQADRFYADAKGQEEAFTQGKDAVTKAQNPSGDNLATDSPEALLQQHSNPRYATEPPAAQQRRADAFRAGLKSGYGEQIAGADTDQGLQSILGLKSLGNTPQAAKVRSLMFSDPADAQKLNDLLAQKQGAALQSGPGTRIPTHGLVINAVRSAAHLGGKPNLLNTPMGQQLLSQRLNNPALMGQDVTNFRAGSQNAAQLRNLIINTLTARATR